MAVKYGLVDRDGVRKKIQQLSRQAPQIMMRALRQEAEIEATESKRRTPVDLGNLRASVHVEGPQMKGKNVEVAIVAGGPAAPYALFVHEDLNAHHRVGQAKFIESTLKESAPFLAARIAKRIYAGYLWKNFIRIEWACKH
jgi:hypothetical protein